MVTGGANLGRIGVITNRERHPGSFDVVHVKDSTGNSFATRLSNIFVIGKVRTRRTEDEGLVSVQTQSLEQWWLLLVLSSDENTPPIPLRSSELRIRLFKEQVDFNRS